MEKVLLGFSGGVDSTAAAISLREQGYNVKLLMLDTNGNFDAMEKARDIAGRLGMELDFSDVRLKFQQTVIDYFTDSYCRGETPAPCSVCNEQIKWKTLYDKAMEYDCSKIATGHYFRIASRDGKYYVKKGADPVKDQSYFLWALPQNYLAVALTPMGDRIKSDVKRSHGHLVSAAESMGVCFLNDRSYGDFLRKRVPSIMPGLVKDKTGNIVGSHDGCALYTIGQKKGFECSVPNTVVVGIDAAENTLTAGADADLYSYVLELDGCRVVDLRRLLESSDVTVKIRGIGRNPEGFVKVGILNENRSHKEDLKINLKSYSTSTDSEYPLRVNGTGSAHIAVSGENLRLRVVLSDPAWAAAKGQSVVFYEGDLVLGGGYLKDYR